MWSSQLIETIVFQTEEAISYPPSNQADITRQVVVAQVIQTSKPPPSNLTIKERQVLKDIHNNPNIVVPIADKGNATVVLNTSYLNKINNLLNTSDKIVPNDPITS